MYLCGPAFSLLLVWVVPGLFRRTWATDAAWKVMGQTLRVCRFLQSIGQPSWPVSVKTLGIKQVGYRAARLHHLRLWRAFTELIHLPSAKETRNNNNNKTDKQQSCKPLPPGFMAPRFTELIYLPSAAETKIKQQTTELGFMARFHRITLPSICQRIEKQQQNRQAEELQAFTTCVYGALSQRYSTFHLPKKWERKNKNNNNQTAQPQAFTTCVYGPLSQN